MRILQVGPLPPEAGGNAAGGIPTHLWALARVLASRGHDIAVLADNVPFSEPWPVVREGVAIFGTAGFRGPRRTRALLGRAGRAVPGLKAHFGPKWGWRWVASKAAAFAAAAEAFSPDVVHVHAPEARFPFAAKLAGVPIVATVHSVHYIEFAEPERREAHRRLVERNLALASDLAFVSEFVMAQYDALFGPAMVRVRRHVVPNPLDAAVYRPLPRAASRVRLSLPAEDPVVLFVGSFIPRKDPATLLDALAKLHARGTHALGVFVGGGPEEDALRARAAELGLRDSVRFEGIKPAEELAAYYSAANVFALPSLMESFGLVFLEALACGCPVVGTPEVLGEILPDETYGLKVEPGDPDALADALIASMTQQHDAERLRRYAETFDWRVRIGQFEELYRGLA